MSHKHAINEYDLNKGTLKAVEEAEAIAREHRDKVEIYYSISTIIKKIRTNDKIHNPALKEKIIEILKEMQFEE